MHKLSRTDKFKEAAADLLTKLLVNRFQLLVDGKSTDKDNRGMIRRTRLQSLLPNRALNKHGLIPTSYRTHSTAYMSLNYLLSSHWQPVS